MEENNTGLDNAQEQNTQENSAQHKDLRACRYWKEFLCLLIAAFLGGFLAIYVVTDQVLYRNYKKNYITPERIHRQMIKDFDREFERGTREFERNFNRIEKDLKKDFNPFFIPDMKFDGVNIKTEIDNDDYKVIIDLKAFNGDDSRIQYNVLGRKLTVFGSSKVKDKKFEQDIAFSQDFLLPDNAVISKIKKEKNGNKLIIEVPLK